MIDYRTQATNAQTGKTKNQTRRFLPPPWAYNYTWGEDNINNPGEGAVRPNSSKKKVHTPDCIWSWLLRCIRAVGQQVLRKTHPNVT